MTIGQGSTVGSNSHITHSVIGKNCTIGVLVLLVGHQNIVNNELYSLKLARILNVYTNIFHLVILMNYMVAPLLSGGVYFLKENSF